VNVIVGEAVEVSVGGIGVSVKVRAGVRVEGMGVVVFSWLQQLASESDSSIDAVKSLSIG